MLQLIAGRSGSGKTRFIREKLCDSVWAGRTDHILLVPEQFSFESERELIKTLGVQRAAGIRVLSFTRMAEIVQRDCGGFAGRRMDDGVRVLLMSRALESCADHLKMFGRVSTDPGMVESALAVMKEFTQCGISAQLLEQTAGGLPEGALQAKTRDLSLVFSAYEAMLSGVRDADVSDESAGHYIDPLDDLSVLAEALMDGTSPQTAFARGALVFVDGFKSFTVQELQVLRALMRRAETVTVALGTDTLDDGNGLFAAVSKTARVLRDMARMDHVPVAAPVILEENRRAKTPALLAAERGMFRPRPAVFEDADDSVIIARCADIYEECAFAARSIRRYLREEGGRCRDIAVVVRNLDPYRGILDAALEKQGIAFIEDERTDILTQPVSALLLSALDAVTEGFSSEDVLRLLKTGMAGFSTRSVSMLENYVLMWGISGRKWLDEWTWNPAGLTASADEKTGRQLMHLNLLRRRLADSLVRLRDAVGSPGATGAGCTGADFARALYHYLTEVRAPRIVKLRAERLDAAGEPDAADKLLRLWDMLMDMLDTFAAVFAKDVMPPARMTALFRLLIQTADLGSVPQSLDAVQIGAADRIRFSQPKTVYILGANEGEFPAWPSSGRILTDTERRALTGLGLPLSGGAEDDAMEERLLAYLAVAAPSERLVVCYVTGNAAGEPLSESALVKSLRAILPGCKALPVDGGALNPPEETESLRDGFDSAASVWTDGTPEAAALKDLFSENPAYAERTAALDRASRHAPAAFEDSGAAAKLFGRDMVLSPSMVESYHQCRFQYFCRYGLRAMPRRAAEMDGLTSGTVIHEVLETVLPGYVACGYKGIDKKQVMDDASAAVICYAERVMGGLEDKPRRFTVLLNKLARTAGLLLWRVVSELRQSRFEPVDYELPVGMPSGDNAGVPSVVLTLPDGSNVRVVGKIDRVDMYRRDGQAYVRVVDYKSSARELLLSDVVEGINMQMLIYLFSLWQNGQARYHDRGEIVPAGVLYLPGALPVVNVEDRHDAESDGTERTQLKAMKMTGLLLDDPEIVRAMEVSAEGVFIPAAITSKGSFSRGSAVVSLTQFGALRKQVDSLLTDMARMLRGGDIAAVPAAGTADACRYCEYFSVCGFEAGDKVRYIEKRPPEEVLRDVL